MTIIRADSISLVKDNNKQYVNFPRPWKEELMYFLLVDRFHPSEPLPIKYHVENEFDELNQEQLLKRFGGTFKGIELQLDYLKNLGCTTLWLSPVFENYEDTYHGYAINNFLAVDPRFGSLAELKSLVHNAHEKDIRIVLDIVINHTADTWTYEEDHPVYEGKKLNFGKWRDARYPLPQELRTKDYYATFGSIQRWDEYPETREGDIVELKKLLLNNSPIGNKVLEVLITCYCYWIKELDIDGFRLDTVKHIHPATVAKFCKTVKEYTAYLGKQDFLIFGEVVGGEALIKSYTKPIKTKEGILPGLPAVLDFPLHFILEEVVKGKLPSKVLYEVYQKKLSWKIKQSKQWSDFIVFADNHDQIGQQVKKRIGTNAAASEVIAIVGFLYFLYGIPCLYYGTEQHFQGSGEHDAFLRVPMFDQERNYSFHNPNHSIYLALSKLALLRKSRIEFVEGILEDDTISINGGVFLPASQQNELVYLSKSVFVDQLFVLYSSKEFDNLEVNVQLSSKSVRREEVERTLRCIFGDEETLVAEFNLSQSILKIILPPRQLIILEYRT